MRTFYKWVPSVLRERCLGCGICGEVCPHRCLEVVDGVGVLARPEACSSDAVCVSACPQQALQMDWSPVEATHAVGRWRPAGSRRPATTAHK